MSKDSSENSKRRISIQARRLLFWKLLEGENGAKVGEAVSFEQFCQESQAELKTNIRSPKPDAPYRNVETTLRAMKKEIERHPRIPGTRLIVGRKNAYLERSNVIRVIDDRAEHRREIKRKIGVVTWNLLFMANYKDGQHIFNETCKDGTAFQVEGTRTLERKVAALRQQSPISICVDAGSTTRAAITELLNTEAMPIHINTGENAPERLIIPAIITNSPEIALEISKSKHRGDIPVTLLGGELRADRGSICGTLTQLWLNLWQSQNGLAGDVSLIGSTGFRPDRKGTDCFGCGDLDESRVKGSFLSLTWLRVIIIDSSKLYSIVDSPKSFASLESGTVDLVVTDDGGTDDNYRTAVTKFRNAARINDIATAMVVTTKGKQ
jgi:DeoR/GlpR family transcriptional regulator of sugar metabolism